MEKIFKNMNIDLWIQNQSNSDQVQHCEDFYFNVSIKNDLFSDRVVLTPALQLDI